VSIEMMMILLKSTNISRTFLTMSMELKMLRIFQMFEDREYLTKFRGLLRIFQIDEIQGIGQ
jgi:hypothetical protein